MTEFVARVRERVLRLEDEIARMLDDAGRTGPVRIVGVVKGRTNDESWALYEAGVRHLAENRWEALRDKESFLRTEKGCDPCLHFIGALQRRALKSMYRPVVRIDTVDRKSIFPVLSEQAKTHGARQDILLEIDLTGIPGRSGVRPEGLDDLIQAGRGYPDLRPVGFLVMGPPPGQPSETRRVFEEGRRLFDRHFHGNEAVLSMGMTDDFPEAIRAGATEIRLGRYFFESDGKESR
jgi:uncharacterized pyridoxal phosphate-containing UPF0001 family protein